MKPSINGFERTNLSGETGTSISGRPTKNAVKNTVARSRNTEFKTEHRSANGPKSPTKENGLEIGRVTPWKEKTDKENCSHSSIVNQDSPWR